MLDAAQIRRLAHLARIAVTDDEVAGVRDQLNGIFALIERMQAVDTTGVEPMSHAQDIVLRLRDDAVTETDAREAFQAVAPQVESHLYLVPRVVE